jgi:hypothetical protein
MPDLKISQLTPAVSLTGTEILPLAISGTNESATTAQVAGLAASSLTDTYIPFSDNGVFADSYLVNDTDILKTVYSGNDIGLFLDFANNSFALLNNTGIGFSVTNNISFLGDYQEAVNGTYLIVDDTSSFIGSYYGGSQLGLGLNFATSTYYLGEINNADGLEVTLNNTTRRYLLGDLQVNNNGTNLQIDDNQSYIKTQYLGSDLGLLIDYANTKYRLGADDDRGFVADGNSTFTMGDPNTQGSYGTTLKVDDNLGIIATLGNGQTKGLLVDLNNEKYNLGDYDQYANGTRIEIQDPAQTIKLLAQGGDIYLGDSGNVTNGLNIYATQLYVNNIPTNPTAGALVGYLTVNISGTDRKIPYYAV